MLGRSEDIEVLRLMYAAPVEAAEPWQDFLAALASLTRARCALLLLESGSGRHLFAHGQPPPLPPREVLRSMRGERLYAEGELNLEAPLRALRVNVRPDTQAWLAIARPQGAFRAADGAQLARLAPHLAQAVDNWLALAGERARAKATAALARDLGAGWLWLDATARVSDCSPQARAWIDTAPGLRLAPDGRLEIADPPVARALRRAVDRAITGDKGPHQVTLDRDTGLHLALRPGLATPAPGLEPVLRAAIRQAPAAARLDHAPLAEALGLNRSEARLAVLLCDGATLAEAAAHLGWTIETARSASKRIYAQTGARGQSDLIRRMLTGALWFGPD